jgi:hypothetical protein
VYDRNVASVQFYLMCIFNNILQEFKRVINKGIQLTNKKIINTMLYEDDQILMATSEDELQTMAYRLNLRASTK